MLRQLTLSVIASKENSKLLLRMSSPKNQVNYVLPQKWLAVCWADMLPCKL